MFHAQQKIVKSKYLHIHTCTSIFLFYLAKRLFKEKEFLMLSELGFSLGAEHRGVAQMSPSDVKSHKRTLGHKRFIASVPVTA